MTNSSDAPSLRVFTEVLEEAAALIEPEGRWAGAWTARMPGPNDKSISSTCLATDPRASQWGGVGAIYKVGRAMGLSNEACWMAQEIAAKAVGAKRFSDWAFATHRQQSEVVSALRRAASLGNRKDGSSPQDNGAA